ncbi:hypothetical protein [Fodinibius sediminis]|uniref:Uncharacterized protein n=1 Tax=Fodinibius sediminis TaxID=1214077 RepID=A0A521DZ38_9BACT|nr:hypothetical protein [Fodinibius sediminis]SMO76321.1 hypothetical protein SAMN06265218_11234 [Fodinibius sediminis]
MYIIDTNKQYDLIREMKQLRKDSKKLEVYYHHPYTNQMWKSFFPLSDGETLGPKLLRHEPLPKDVEECLDICLTEDVPENAQGLGIEWSAYTSLWPQIIKVLEKNYSDYLRGQLKLFLNHLNMGEVELPSRKEEPVAGKFTPINDEQLNNLIWRSRKVRMKRFFVLR